MNLILVLSVFSQKNFQAGYIVTAANDTVKGYIKSHNWVKNPDAVIFRQSTEGIEKVYLPGQLKAFAVANDIYESGIVTMDDSPYKIGELTDLKYNFVTDTVFLLSLIKGDKNLYLYQDKNSKEHFFITIDSSFKLLIYKRYLKLNDQGIKDLTEDKRYLGQLRIYLGDCPDILHKIQEVRYDKNSLLSLFSYYYSCSKNKLVSLHKDKIRPFEYGAIIGLSLTKADYYSEFPVSKRISGGLSLTWKFQKHSNRFSMRNELLYNSFKTKSAYSFSRGYNEGYTGNIIHYIRMNNMGHVSFPDKNLQLFLNAGISTGFMIYESYEEVKKPANLKHRTSCASLINQVNVGFPLGFGVAYKRYSFEIRGLAD